MRARIRRLLTAFGSTYIDGSESVTRSEERYRKAAWAGLVAALARAISIAAVLVTIPITLKYLGVERFSIWMTITSLTALLSFADFGLGNGLMNAVARCKAKGNDAEASEYISTAFLILGSLALFGVGFALIVAPHIAWRSVLAVNSPHVSANELSTVMMAFILCLSIGIPAAIVQKVQLAMQLGYLANLWQLLASAAALIVILIAVKLRATLAWLVFGAMATPSAVLFLSAIIFWKYQNPSYRPKILRPKSEYVRELMGSGTLFFTIQLAVAIAFSSDTLIVAHLLGPEKVAQYSVMSRLIDGIVMISALFLTPLWPAYTDANATRDAPWIRKTLILSLAGTMIATLVASAALVLASRFITQIWVGSEVPYSMALFAAGGVWAVIKATGNAWAMFLNGMGLIGFQAIVAVIFAVLSVITKVLFAQSMGIIGVPIALISSYIAAIVIPYVCQLPRILARI